MIGHTTCIWKTARGPILRVWVLDEQDLQVLERIALGAGTPFAIAARGERAWLAMGEEGLLRVELTDGGEARVLRGPDTSALKVPAGFRLAPGLVRDVALGSTHLYAAADSAGLLALDLQAPWGARTPLEVHALSLDDQPTYALRVAARGTRVAVGTLRGPARAADGAPYGHFGAIGLGLEVGGVSPDDYPMGDVELLLRFEREGERLVRKSRVELPTCGWRGLELGRERIYAMHLVLGLVVRDATRAQLPVLARRRSRGLPAVDGRFGLLDPELLLFGVDSEGARTGGLHRTGADGRIAPIPGTERALDHSLTIGAQWLDQERGCEWLLGGRGFSWWLQRIVPGSPPTCTRWKLRPPPDAEGRAGNTYFNSARDGDLLLLTRAYSRFGLLTTSASALADRASALAPGSTIELEPFQTVETHPAGGAGLPRTWQVDVAVLPDGRRIAVVAAGSHTDLESPQAGRARILIFELGADPRDAPRKLAEVFGAAPRGMAMAVETLRIGRRTCALVADLNGQLIVLDITRPMAARPIGTWTAPRNPFSRRPEPLLDVAVDERSATAFLAAGNVGVVCLDLRDASAPRTLQIVDTPGWATGVCFDERGDRARLAVGDQKGGLRLYAWSRAEKE